MKHIRSFFYRSKIYCLILVLTSSMLSFNGDAPAADEAGMVVALADIIVSLKIDPRLTRGQYMGDRWVSLPYTSTLQTGTQVIVEARAVGRDPRGKSMVINPTWIPTDPEMVEILPEQGNEVTIMVKHAGLSRLKVVSQEFAKELQLKAITRGKGLQVEISQ